MKKFVTLLMKEIRELLTPQMVLPFVLIMIVFSFVGDIMTSEQKKQADEGTSIVLVDRDQSDLTKSFEPVLASVGFSVTSADDADEQVLQDAQKSKAAVVAIVPGGYEESLRSGQRPTVRVYSIFRSFGVISSAGPSSADSVVALINEATSTYVFQQAEIADPSFLKQPVSTEGFVIVNGRQAKASAAEVFNVIASQVFIVPIVLFLVITLAAQMVATAVATEKENKTLETLLSAPVDRKSIVAAKLLGAGIVSLLMAVTYLYGMKNYMGGMTGMGSMVSADGVQDILAELGLIMSAGDYLLLGVSLFLGILAALSLAFVLGVFAEDTRSAQGVIAPIMVMLLVPYLLTMLLDISAMSLPLKVLMYAIPFTHTFTSVSNILFGNTMPVIYGDLYLLLWVLVCIYLASRIFTSDKILTLRLSLKKKGLQAI